MKKLQEDHTTPEQSKRLLELGVPKDSANLYNVIPTGYIGFCRDKTFSEIRNEIISVSRTKYHPIYTKDDIIPCWSVGRLIEIYIICIEHYTGDKRLIFGQYTVRLGMIDCIIAAIEVGCDDGDIDFSKLEK